MNLTRTILRTIYLLLLPILIAAVPATAFGANCEKKPDHPDCVDPPPDDGGNDTSDPDWAISADLHSVTAMFSGTPLFDPPDLCLAYNPDLKGPGIAYSGFYPRESDCQAIETSDGVLLNGQTTLAIETDDNGDLVLLEFRSRDSVDNALHKGWANINTTPNNEGDFTIHVDQVIELFRCEKVRGKTQCNDSVGFIAVEDLNYLMLP